MIDRKKLKEILKEIKRKKILVVGDLILDKFIWGDVSRISPEAPVPIVEVIKEDLSLGGAGNVSLNIKEFGADVFLISATGKDENGKILKKMLSERGIEYFLLERDTPTITKTRIIARTQQLVRIDREKREKLNFREAGMIKEIIKEKINKVDGVIISDYGKGMITEGIIKELRKLKEKYGKITTIDPKVEHFSYYKKFTCLTPNRFEASEAVHKKAENLTELIDTGIKIKNKLSPDYLIITIGKEGMIVFEKNIYHIPSVAKEVYDVTGAGDTVIGILTLCLSAGADILVSSIISNIAAGIVVGKLGTATVKQDEVKKFFEKNLKYGYIEKIK
ncbi:D-glycero-beta-D-manno-heptose-7-phosphate kinase [bacterium]|nr:D-glycero-beta-D-manno-heptose-7-phosphate kinase [bacterium]